jgi:S-adenosylmethionine:tRNA ribosyltransferase-isomerase
LWIVVEKLWITEICCSMPHPRDLPIDAFDYTLPDHRIARFPLPERDASKLLIYRDGIISESIYAQLADQLPEGSVLVFNNTKVLEARLVFTKESGGAIEVFTLEPSGVYPSMEIALAQQGSVEWNCLVGGAAKWKPGTILKKIIANGNEYLQLEADRVAKTEDAFRIRFSWTPSHLTFPEVLHLAGQVPLPPYLKRAATPEDGTTYQTVYAQRQGSVAAPTAGLHFTESIFRQLETRRIASLYLTLHVGAGTFRPVKSTTIEGHEMHSEYIDLQRATIQSLRDAEGPIYAVGTTSLRTLESLYWMGLRCMQNPEISAEQLVVGQWDPYASIDWERTAEQGMDTNRSAYTSVQRDDLFDKMMNANRDGYVSNTRDSSREESLSHLLAWMDARSMTQLISRTQILIAPGYRFRMIRGLITNFHQPKSTLLLLIAALVGDNWKRIYQYALDHEFRFLSYGDGSLLEGSRDWGSPV